MKSAVSHNTSALSGMNPALLTGIADKKRQLDTRRPFPPEIVRKLDEQFTLEWTYNSNAIEGNTLTLRETELVINRGLTIGNKTLREHFEAINHKEGVQFLYDLAAKKRQIDEDAILELHKIILKNISDTDAGRYRTSNVRITGAFHIPPSAIKVPRLVQEFLDWYHQNEAALPIPELAAWVHYKLVYIHPFIDGNGRTARLLSNLILIQNGYPPAVILTIDRKKYYRVLEEADHDRFSPFMDFIGRSIERSLLIYLNAINSQNDVDDKYGYITLRQAAELCGKSESRLSALARSGKLQAVKNCREWLTTREALGEMR
jgi:Fic family protein